MIKYSKYETWYETTVKNQATYSALNQDIDCEVCIVGGGMVGVSAAMHLAEKGIDVVLLESSQIAYGSTGRSGTPILSGFNVDLSDIADLVGEDNAKEMWQMTIDARDEIIEKIKEYDIDCGFTEGVVHFARNKKQESKLVKRADELNVAFPDDPVSILGDASIQNFIKSTKIYSGIRYKKGGHFHPINFLYEIARVAEKNGAKIYESSPVSRIIPGNRPVVQTEYGQVKCKHLLVCGNAFMDGLMPPEKTSTVTTNLYQLVTEPMSPDLVRHILPGREVAIDMHYTPEYFYITPSNRIVFGGPDAYSRHSDAFLSEKILGRLRRIFPQSKGVKVDYLWRGPVGATMNYIPVFEMQDSNIYMVHGFSGHGITMSYLGGKLMAEAVTGNPGGFDAFARIHQAHIPKWLHHTLAKLGLAYYRLKDSFV